MQDSDFPAFVPASFLAWTAAKERLVSSMQPTSQPAVRYRDLILLLNVMDQQRESASEEMSEYDNVDKFSAPVEIDTARVFIAWYAGWLRDYMREAEPYENERDELRTSLPDEERRYAEGEVPRLWDDIKSGVRSDLLARLHDLEAHYENLKSRESYAPKKA